jgi:DNA-binding LacI/PurR family transcriptional regulator
MGVGTISDIARLAGVSKSTVSRALNDSPLIGAETKQRIRAIAQEHHFKMNAPARRLSLKQSHAIAMANVAWDADSAEPDTFMLEVMGGVASALYASGYDLLVVAVDERDGADWARDYLQSGRADGVILPACMERHLHAFTAMKAPFVIWGLPPGNYSYCTVSGDSFTGGKLATDHLLQTGRTRVAFLSGPESATEVRERYRGYETALQLAGREVDQSLVVRVEWCGPAMNASCSTAVAELLEREPDLDGIFAISDRVAIAAIDALRAHGRRVPEDVGVVGYDDISIARHINPPLTTIRQNGPLAGRLLAETLVRHLETGAIANVSIPAELVVRGSA